MTDWFPLPLVLGSILIAVALLFYLDDLLKEAMQSESLVSFENVEDDVIAFYAPDINQTELNCTNKVM